MFWKARNGSSAPSIVIGCFVAMGGLLFGWDTGNINGILAMDAFVKQYATPGHHDSKGQPALTSGQISLMVSILSAGTVMGSLTANQSADRIGRRWSLSLASFIFTIGVVIQTVADAIPLFVIGRMVTGFGIGQVSVLVPLYQVSFPLIGIPQLSLLLISFTSCKAESAPKWIRGTIIGCYQLSITLGLLLTTIVSNATEKMPNSSAYRIPIALQSILSLTLGVGMIFLPETPRFLIKNGRHPEAIRALCKLRALPPDNRHLQEELQEIEVFAQAEAEVGKASWADCFRGSGGNMGKRLITGCGLQALQQLTGINFIFYYGTNFFKHSGVEKPFIIALVCNLVNVIATVPGLYLVEKAGRAPLLFVGALGMGVTQLIIAIVGITTNSTISNKVLVAIVCIYIAFFACTWGLGGWIVTGEIFPLRVRAKSMSLTASTNWVVNWALGYSTPYLVDRNPGSAGLGVKIFFLWSGFCFLSVYFVHKFIRETKGISLEQIDSLYQGGTAAKIRNRISIITSNSSSIRKRDSRHLDNIIPSPQNPYPYFPTLAPLESALTNDSTNNLHQFNTPHAQHHEDP